MTDIFVYGIVAAVIVGAVLFFGWAFNKYALMETFHFLKVTYEFGAVVFGIAVIALIDAYYPLAVVRVGVPALFSAVMVHCLILLSAIYTQQAKQQKMDIFLQRIMIIGNYVFFTMITLLLVHLDGSFLDTFFYYITEVCVKVGLVISLYLLIKIRGEASLTQTSYSASAMSDHEQHLFGFYGDDDTSNAK